LDRASRSAVLLVVGLGYGALALVPAVAAAIVVVVAETWRGRVYGVAALLLLAVAPLVVRALLRRTRARVAAAGATAATVAGLVVLLYVASPDGRPLPGSPLRSEFLADARYPRASVAALLPEIDQVKLATYLAPAMDPIIDVAQARRIREMTLRHYRVMEADPELVALGTVMPYAYLDRDAGHLYAYAPPHGAGERLPAVVFLHGSAGNFKAYFHLWRRFADAARVLVVCPSFGFGNWYEPHGVEAIERARAWAVATLGADERRIFLVGLSNGGTGVTRAAAASPAAYRGIAFLSGVLEDEVLLDGARPGGAASLPWPILVIHGKDDDRIPLAEVTRSIARLRARGATLEERVVDGEDHFLFFDRDAEVLAWVQAWMKDVEARDTP